MILSLISLKGGVGKTTSAFFLAAVALERVKKGPVVLVDADDEHSAAAWWDHVSPKPSRLSVVTADRNGFARQVRELSQGTTGQPATVVIDCPPNNREMLNRAASVSDHVLVPVRATGIDLDRLRSTLELLSDVDAQRGGLDVAVLFTHWRPRRIISREALEALSEFPVLNSKIRQLAVYEESHGTMPAGDALEEYRAVWKEVTR
jgi:chromosome partitioning protein